MIPDKWLTEAVVCIAPHIVRTPLTYDPANQVYLKWENHQVTGSFKARGALNKVLNLQPWELERGLVTASAGNHGQGVALAGQQAKAHVIVFASDHATPSKVEAMRVLGAEVRLVQGGYEVAEQTGLQYASQNRATWISPYNDGHVIAGQGTIALEILEQMADPGLANWVVPAGGGGLAAGIGSVLSYRTRGRAKLVGVSSEASPFLHGFYHSGTQDGIIEYPSLADGLAGPVEPGSVTIPLAQKYLDDFVLVTEEEIEKAIVYAWQTYHEKIEGSAATALAAVLYGKVSQRPAIVILTGGNIQPELHIRMIHRGK